MCKFQAPSGSSEAQTSQQDEDLLILPAASALRDLYSQGEGTALNGGELVDYPQEVSTDLTPSWWHRGPLDLLITGSPPTACGPPSYFRAQSSLASSPCIPKEVPPRGGYTGVFGYHLPQVTNKPLS